MKNKKKKGKALHKWSFLGLLFALWIIFPTQSMGKINEQKDIEQNVKKNITGAITDSSEPLIGVSIQIKGTSIGTITDVNGRFSMEASGKSSERCPLVPV